MTNLYENLSWLLEPPKDFSKILSETTSSSELRELAKYSLDDNQLSRLSKKLNSLKVQMDRLNAIGGFDAIVPSEGIVFKYNGKTYKFTGAFAPINQITGLISF